MSALLRKTIAIFSTCRVVREINGLVVVEDYIGLTRIVFTATSEAILYAELMEAEATALPVIRA